MLAIFPVLALFVVLYVMPPATMHVPVGSTTLHPQKEKRYITEKL
jgi:hypothetical protein